MRPQDGKRCSLCKKWKALDEFYPRRTARGDKRQSRCKECDKKTARRRSKREAYRFVKSANESERTKPRITRSSDAGGRETVYPENSVLNTWPKDENGRLLNYWAWEE